MPGATDMAGFGLVASGVLRPLGKENVNTPSAAGRTPDRRLKPSASAGFPVFQDETCASTNEKLKLSSPKLLEALKHAETEAAKYKEQLRETQASLQARHERVQELKTAAASINQQHTALLKNHEEAIKELGLVRAMAENSELLREERGLLEAKLAKREAALSFVKKEVAAATERESNIREELERVRRELEIASQESNGDPNARREGIAAALEGRRSLEKAALDAQIKELEEQLTASQRRCSAVVAERAVLAEEATRRGKEHSAKVAALQNELNSLQRRTSADLGDWQRRHREALGAKRAAEGQLERLVGASKSIARFAEKQAVLEASLQEACELLSQGLLTESPSVGSGEGPGSAERVVEGVLEHIMGRVFEATRTEQTTGGGWRDRETEHSLLEEELDLRGKTFENIAADMESLRAFGVKQAEVYLNQVRSLEAELEGERERQVAALSELEASRAESQQEVERLAQRLSDGEKERLEMMVRLESAAQELATTVQLSELALAAKDVAGENGRSEDDNRRSIAEAQQRVEELETQIKKAREKLDSERQACAKKVDALQEENRDLQDKLKGLSSQASALMDKEVARERDERLFRVSGLSFEEAAARESELKELETRLAAVVAENEELARRVEAAPLRGEPARKSSSDGRSRIMELEAEVSRLREHVSADRERLKKAEEDDQRMRKYVLHYSSRSEQKMKEMQRRLAIATARSNDKP